MSLESPAGTSARPAPGGARRWWLRRLVPLVALGTVAGLAHLAAGGVALYEAADRVRGVAGPAAGSVPANVEEQRRVAVTALLATMTVAVRTGDVDAYLSVAPPGDAALRQRMTRTFGAVRRLPLRNVSYDWSSGTWSRPAGLTARYRDEEAVVAVVQRRSTLPGWDRGETAESLGLSFARRDGRWLLVGDTDGKEVLPDSATPEPWTVGDVTVLTRKHVLLVGDRPLKGDGSRKLGRLADRIEDAVGGVRDAWPGAGWNGKVVVYALTADTFVGPWFGDRASDGTTNKDSETAEFDAEVVPLPAPGKPGERPRRTGGGPAAGLRLVVSPAVLDYDSADTRALMRHELTHVATASDAAAPAWLVEGVAEYTAFRSGSRADGVGNLDRRGLPPAMWGALKRSSYRPKLEAEHDAFYAGTSGEVSRRYSDSWLTVLWIAHEYGEPRLRAFLARASDPELGTVEAREAAAFRDVLKTPEAEVVDDAAAYARKIRRSFK